MAVGLLVVVSICGMHAVTIVGHLREKRALAQLRGAGEAFDHVHTVVGREGFRSTQGLGYVNPPRVLKWLGGRYAGLYRRTRCFVGTGRISDSDLAKISTLRRLLFVGLYDSCGYTTDGIADLTHLDELEGLLLAGRSSFTDADASVLPELSNLRWLCLSGSDITDSSVPALLRIKRLEYVDISNTLITAEGAAMLQRGRSQLQVVHSGRPRSPP
jgi:hypothetical protein